MNWRELAGKTGGVGELAGIGGQSLAEEGIKYRGTLWHFGSLSGTIDHSNETDHPARFCTALAEDVVQCFCPPDGLVCDPFSGSGTSALAAVRHGRRFFGGDLLCRTSDSKSWADVGLERVQRYA